MYADPKWAPAWCAPQAAGSAAVQADRTARVSLLGAWLRSLVEPSLRKFSAFGAKQLPVNRAFDELHWEGVSDVTEVKLPESCVCCRVFPQFRGTRGENSRARLPFPR